MDDMMVDKVEVKEVMALYNILKMYLVSYTVKGFKIFACTFRVGTAVATVRTLCTSSLSRAMGTSSSSSGSML